MEFILLLLVLFVIVRNFMKDKSDHRDPIGRPLPGSRPSVPPGDSDGIHQP